MRWRHKQDIRTVGDDGKADAEAARARQRAVRSGKSKRFWMIELVGMNDERARRWHAHERQCDSTL